MAIKTILQSIAPVAFLSKLCFCAPFKKDEEGNWCVSKPLAVLGFLIQFTAIVNSMVSIGKAAVKFDVLNDIFLALSFAHVALSQVHRGIFLFNTSFNYQKIAEVSFYVINISDSSK